MLLSQQSYGKTTCANAAYAYASSSHCLTSLTHVSILAAAHRQAHPQGQLHQPRVLRGHHHFCPQHRPHHQVTLCSCVLQYAFVALWSRWKALIQRSALRSLKSPAKHRDNYKDVCMRCAGSSGTSLLVCLVSCRKTEATAVRKCFQSCVGAAHRLQCSACTHTRTPCMQYRSTGMSKSRWPTLKRH